jgi:hypothetical protein
VNIFYQIFALRFVLDSSSVDKELIQYLVVRLPPAEWANFLLQVNGDDNLTDLTEYSLLGIKVEVEVAK